jgi:hypothetical protein
MKQNSYSTSTIFRVPNGTRRFFLSPLEKLHLMQTGGEGNPPRKI